MSNLPTLVFIPGAWHKPACYDKVVKLLHEKHKLKCISITLPSTTDDPAATFKDDLDAASNAISGETSHGRDVVVVAHSYGGMVGNSAIKGFSRCPHNAISSDSHQLSGSAQAKDTDNHRASSAGYVIGLILIASGCNIEGLAFMDPFFGRPPPSWRVNKETGYAEIVIPPRELFYHDLPEDEGDYWVSQLTNHSLKSLFEGGEFTYAGWMDVPVWYIGTTEDQGLPVVAQRMGVGMAREMGGNIEHRELQTSHSPFLSQPEKTVEIMVEAVEAFTGQPPVKVATRDRGGNEISLPEARLWQPFTWFRFGLPIVFGRILGRCILVFNWSRRLWRSG
jgi:pimeloyl-ACP methyl ester carboxylesterase